MQITVEHRPAASVFRLAHQSDRRPGPGERLGGGDYPATFTDRVTNVTTPSFFGTAEAKSIVKLYVDRDMDPTTTADDVFIGQTVAVPLDGNNAYPNGQWNLT